MYSLRVTVLGLGGAIGQTPDFSADNLDKRQLSGHCRFSEMRMVGPTRWLHASAFAQSEDHPLRSHPPHATEDREPALRGGSVISVTSREEEGGGEARG